MSRMTRLDWLRRQSRPRRTQVASRHDRQLRVEPLEERRMLATFTVSNLSDGAVAAAGDLPGSLRQALFDAEALAGADTIEFTTTGTINMTAGVYVITEDLTITGPGADQLTLSHGGGSRVLRIEGGANDISGLTLTGGNVGRGGGIRNDAAATTTLTDLAVTGNTATTNDKDAGGGIWNAGDLTINDSTISGNETTGTEGSGGGIHNSGTLEINRSTLSGNSSAYDGGAIYNVLGGDVTITDSTIASNYAGDDIGGIFNFGTLTVSGSTISGNSAASIGGAIATGSGDTSIVRHSTIVDNTGGIFNTGSTTLDHTIVANNTNFDISGTVDADWSLIEDTTGATINGANNITGTDPMLDLLADNGGPTQTHALLAGSQALNGGDPRIAGAPANDQRGGPFIRESGTIDIGAYELQTLNLVVDTLDDESDGNFSALDLSLREALELTNANPGADTVTFDGGLSGTINLQIALGQLIISDDVTITGLGASTLTVDAGGNSRVLLISSGTVDISGLTLTGGSSDSGGGLRNENGATTTLTAMVITGNSVTAAVGGPELGGGGILNDGDLTIDQSTVSGNMALNTNVIGGGIYTISGSNTNINSSTISDNTSVARGGGILGGSSSTVTITDSTISGNSTNTTGGGLFVNYGTTNITGSTITGNTANTGGGGIYEYDSDETNISYSTITGNSTNSSGGGIRAYASTLTLSHTIVSGNMASTGSEIHRLSGTITLDDYNLLGESTNDNSQAFSGFTVPVGTDITATSDGNDPTLLTDILDTTLADNGGPTLTHALVAGSPAIDAGNAGAPPANDQRGVPFVREFGTIDIGAYEVQNLSLVVDTLDDELDGDHSVLDLSLREALELANANPGADSVSFAGALALGTINLEAALGQLEISDDVTITGLGADQLTVDAGGNSRVLEITSGTVDISGLTISGGTTTGNNNGGGIISAGDLTISDSTISGNSAGGLGGGIWANGPVEVNSSTISGNTADGGGGILKAYAGDLTVTNSLFTGNVTVNGPGGGIFSYEAGTITIENSTFSGNTADQRGGGVYTYDVLKLEISDSTITDNHAQTGGGGVGSSLSEMVITSSTISGNTTIEEGGGALWFGYANAVTSSITNSTLSGNTGANGGAIYNLRGFLLIDHSTVTLNSAIGYDGDPGYGSGVSSYADAQTRTDVRSSIISGNLADDDVYSYAALNNFVSLGYNLIGGGNDIGAFNQTGDQTGVTNPMLDPLADNGGPTETHALQPGSPAINAGDPSFTTPPDFDQRGAGFSRVALGRIDIGAIERQNESADFDLDGVVSGFDFLRWQLGFGTTATAVHGDGDANFDTDVDNADLDVWELQYGTAAPLVAAAAAPLAAEPLFTNANLADVAQAILLAEETDEMFDTSDSETEQPALETFASEPTGVTNAGANLLRENSSSNSVGEESEQAEQRDSWEEVADEVFASVL